MRGALLSGAPPFIVNLGGGDVAVAEKFLNLTDVDTGVQEKSGRGRAQRVSTVEPLSLLDRPWEFSHIASDDPIHAGLAHGLLTELPAVRRAPGPEDRAGLESSRL